MIINEVDPSKGYFPLTAQKNSEMGISNKRAESFTDSLKEFIKDVNGLQKDSAEQTEKFIKGEPVDIHDVMISAEKAKTGFQLLIELRGKALDLYHEVNRMQV
ncbi:MAG: flagellar hook-basal body complex protein FliE [Bacteroidota bacterium]|nr:flagellar hook-basal body complex protein FliE [Bacteroidota bacterium]